MDKSTVVTKLRAHEAEIRAFGIASLSLFGSVARGAARADSDVDLFCDYDDPKFSLITLVRAEHRISDLLGGVQTDLTTRDSLHPTIRPKVEASAVKIF